MTKGKVLIVDDSRLSRRTLRRIIEGAGFSVVEAEDGMSALEIYFLEKPNAVFLDLVMTGMYGLEVLEKLRDMDAEARVIVATADIQESTRVLAEHKGAVAVVNKPLVADVVLDTLHKTLKGGPVLDSH